MIIKDIMVKDVISIGLYESVLDACFKYKEKKVGCLVVEECGECVGILTERDIIERVICPQRDPKKTKVYEVMGNKIITIHQLEKIEKAVELLKKYRVKKLPVVSNDILVGIVTISDIAKARPELTKDFMEKWINAKRCLFVPD